MFNNRIYRSLRRRDEVEHLTLTTTSAAAVSDSFSTLDSTSVNDVLIQNLSAAGCYITFDDDTAVTATDSHTYLPANGTMALDNCAFAYFSVIRSIGTDVTIRVTGIGRVEQQ